MTDITQAFLQESRGLLVSDYLPKIERCLEHLTDEDVWSRPNEACNSVGNLLLHLRGNITQWIIGGVAGKACQIVLLAKARTGEDLKLWRPARETTPGRP